jgi:predicted nucleotidyltransferase component of viral defense system
MADSEPSVLRPLRLRIGDATRAVGLPQYVVEKDYALGHLLAAMVAVPLLRDQLVFKGGTCLRKAYFADYRFSEDLDFTARSDLECDDLLTALGQACQEMQSSLLAFGPFEVTAAQERHRAPHPLGQCSLRVRVQFPWMRSPDCSLKVEVTADEPLLLTPIERPLIHQYSGESVAATLAIYALEEIAAEKLRAFLQARQHLDDRGWNRNRPRDLYDLWWLRQQHELVIDWSAVSEILPAKAEARGVKYTSRSDFLDERVLQGIERDWYPHLSRFVPNLPGYEVALAEFRTLIEEVIGP